ncbi:MAG: hypothetical protein WB987_17980 [Candidatus Acidiferrales bacterium]
MVFAIAALLLQFNPAPQALAPVFTTKLSASISAEDGTKPKRTASTTADGATTVATTSGTGHLDVNSVKLSGEAGETASSGLTAVSLASDHNSDALSLVRVPEPEPLKPVKVYSAETPRMSRSWLALSLLQHGAATFDAYSTRQAIGHGAVEDDPIMRPFAHSGAIYAAIQVGPLLLDYVARRMQHSENGMIRRMWFVPQSVSTAGFLLSGVHNMGVTSRP